MALCNDVTGYLPVIRSAEKGKKKKKKKLSSPSLQYIAPCLLPPPHPLGAGARGFDLERNDAMQRMVDDADVLDPYCISTDRADTYAVDWKNRLKLRLR